MAVTIALSVSAAGLGCGGKKDASASASSSASAVALPHRSAKPAVVATAAPTTPPSAAAETPKPQPRVDAIIGGLTKLDGPPVTLEKKVTLSSLGVEWSIPSAWVVDDYNLKFGKEKEDRKGCHPPAISPETPYFDVVLPLVDDHLKEEWNGQPFPIAGQKPSGGPDRWDWIPFVSFGLGKDRLPVVATHRQEVPIVAEGEAPAGAYTHVWMFFKHPKNERVGQLMLTWRSGDVASQSILEAIARSVTPI